MATKAVNGRSKDVTTADLTDQIEVLREDISSLTQTIADIGKAKGAEATDAAKAKAAELRDRASATAEAARGQAAQLQGQANDFIRDQPATALGIAAGIGFLVGYMGRRN